MCAFFWKKNFFWQKYYLYLKQWYETCVKDFIVLFSVFVRQKIIVNENVSFIDHASEIRPPDGCKLAINLKKENDIIICWHDVIIIFFGRCCVSLFKFSYWSKFHVNIIIDFGVTVNYPHPHLPTQVTVDSCFSSSIPGQPIIQKDM